MRGKFSICFRGDHLFCDNSDEENIFVFEYSVFEYTLCPAGGRP